MNQTWSAAAASVIALVFAALAFNREEHLGLLRRAGEQRFPSGARRWSLPAPVLWLPALVLAPALGRSLAGVPGSLAFLIAAGAVPIVRKRRRAADLVARSEEQLADAVGAVAAALRSGRSLTQALTFAGAEVGTPLGPSLATVADRAALGASLDGEIVSWAKGVGGSDSRLVAGVLLLHRRMGGDLAVVLDGLSATLRARRSGARELRSLTAQARLSATILGFLPVGFFLFLSLVSRRDIETAYRTTAGAMSIGIGLVLEGAAFLWIRHLLRVDR